MNTFIICSVAQETTFCFHPDSGSLFDSGEGVSILLSDKLKDIKRVFLSDFSNENILGLRSLMEKVPGLEIYYPRQFQDSFKYIKMYEFSRDFKAIWKSIENDETIQINDDYSCKASRVYRQDTNKFCYSYIFSKKKKKRKLELALKTTQELRNMVIEGIDVSEYRFVNEFVYSPGTINSEDCFGCNVIVSGPKCITQEARIKAANIKGKIYTRIKDEEWSPIVIPILRVEVPIPPIFMSHEIEM